MRFAPVFAALSALASFADAPALAQTAKATGWTLVSVGGIAAEPGGRIAFSADGAVFGNTGCNRFNGTAVAAPGLVTFQLPMAITRMACDAALMDQEARVLAALKGTAAVAYDPVSDRMNVIPESDAPALGFARDAE